MSVEGRYFAWSIEAGEDLDDLTPGTGNIFKAVSENGITADNGRDAVGILLYGGKEKEMITLGYSGIIKFAPGKEVIPRGSHLTITKGGVFRVAKEGDWVVGRNLDLASATGPFRTGMFNFATNFRL